MIAPQNATVTALAECFNTEQISVRLKASTEKEYRGNLKRFILPELGNRVAAALVLIATALSTGATQGWLHILP